MTQSRRGFLSYAWEDRAAASKLYEDMQRFGINLWYDQVDFEPQQGETDQQLDAQILNALKESSFVILLLSRQSVAKEKGYVRREIRLALAMQEQFKPSGHFVIPVRIEECQPSKDEAVGFTQFVDLWPDWSAGVALLRSLIPERGAMTDLSDASPLEIHQNIVDAAYLREVALRLTNRNAIGIFLQNCSRRLLPLEPHVISRKVDNMMKNLSDFSSCLELHYAHQCGALDPNTTCTQCKSQGKIIHGFVDVGGFSMSDYNDNYISWCTNCFWSFYLFEIDYLGNGPHHFNYTTNTYG